MRISRHQMFMSIARTASMRSTCHRLSVGAVLVYEGNIVSLGYNGPHSKEPHCQGNNCHVGPTGGCVRAVHAEVNAIRRLSNDLMDEAKTLYVTHSPCPSCAEVIVAANIKQVIYETPYRDTSALEYLVDCGIEVLKLTPSGYLTDLKNNKVLNTEEQE